MIQLFGGRSGDYIKIPRRGGGAKRIGKAMDKNDKIVREKPTVNAWGRMKDRKRK